MKALTGTQERKLDWLTAAVTCLTYLHVEKEGAAVSDKEWAKAHQEMMRTCPSGGASPQQLAAAREVAKQFIEGDGQ